MAPALTPTYTIYGRSDGLQTCEAGMLHPVGQYTRSPPQTSNASDSLTFAAHTSWSMLGSAVSSSTPTDLQPKAETWGSSVAPVIALNAFAGPPGQG